MANKGQKVKAHYRGTLDDGSVFDSSYDRNEPIEFTAGVGQMIPGFDAAILDMEVGEKRTVTIPCAEAYGEFDPQRAAVVPEEALANIEELSIGQVLILPTPDGGRMQIKVVKIEDGQVWLDGNHDLAGEDLTFEIELVSAE